VHRRATRLNDGTETLAIKTCFGNYASQLAISSTKSMLGPFGSAGAIEAAITVLSIVYGIIPPTINLDHPDPACDLDYVPHQARQRRVRVVLSDAIDFYGCNTCLAFKQYE